MYLITLEWSDKHQIRSKTITPKDSTIVPNKIIIGRGEEVCDVVLQHQDPQIIQTVSTTHLAIFYNQNDKNFYAHNLTRNRQAPLQKNPAFIDGKKVIDEMVRIKLGSQIQLGKILIEVKNLALENDNREFVINCSNPNEPHKLSLEYEGLNCPFCGYIVFAGTTLKIPSTPMELQLITQNSVTEEQEQEIFSLPIVLGREMAQLPTEWENKNATPIVLFDASNQISRFHAVIKESNNQIIVEDKSSNGTIINNKKIIKQSQHIRDGDVIQIGNYSITVASLSIGTKISSGNSTIFNPNSQIVSASVQQQNIRSSTILFNPETDEIEHSPNSPVHSANPQTSFPPPEIFSDERVSVSALQRTNLPILESIYASLGGGLGSFVYVDHLRIAGVSSENIAVVGLNPVPYARYERLLNNCQIPRYKRIRSGSDSCPDNIWGWPGYAIREAWRDVFKGNVSAAFTYLWQVFGEPILADTYTPKADDVFKSIDVEIKRIGWNKIFYQGSIRSIRKTDDGRYCIAYSDSKPGHSDHRFLLAKYIHIATGYPALKLLPDLQGYRDTTGDLKSVVQGYEPHSHVYEYLERYGGMVILRGSGIVASQVMDRLTIAYQNNSNIKIIHMNRDPRRGYKFGLAQREVENDWEFQPYNWPKATWGGDMRKMLEEATPLKRRELLQSWGGTTTASRKKWRKTIQKALDEGWYEIRYGLVKQVIPNHQGHGVIATLLTNKGEAEINADFIIDCTGLISNPRENPLLNDLITHYSLDLNPQGRLHVENDFEIKKMRNNHGKIYASGIITLGGPYAAVDTFLGLQYSAHRIVESLATLKTPEVKRIVGFYSLLQWLKWSVNQTP